MDMMSASGAIPALADDEDDWQARVIDVSARVMDAGEHHGARLSSEPDEAVVTFTQPIGNDEAIATLVGLSEDMSEEDRQEALRLDVVGRYEPRLSENGIPEDVLAKLLPGDEVIELEEPVVAGGLVYRFVKRAFDVCSCGVALIVLAIPMAVVALKIKSESSGPAIYAQERVGMDGKRFRVYKFRSMYIDAEQRGAQWATDNDPRITPFGRWMRDHRVDEVPQFWNVVRGDMSLIGPRPERPAFCAEFEKRIHGWNYRTKVRPGLSGLAQVNGGYELLPAEKIVFDFEYMRHRSLALDVRLILRTLGVLGSKEGAR